MCPRVHIALSHSKVKKKKYIFLTINSVIFKEKKNTAIY